MQTAKKIVHTKKPVAILTGAFSSSQSQSNSKSSLVKLDTVVSTQKQQPARVITPTASSKPIQIIKIGS